MQIPGHKRKNKALIIIAATLVVIASIATLTYAKKWWPFNEPVNHIVEGIDYGPPTDEEVEHSQDAKKDMLEEDQNNTTGNESGNENTTSLKKVSVGVSHSDVINGNVEIRAFISGVIEGTGTCSATLTQSGAKSVTRSSKAFVDASTSQCAPILIPLNEFEKTGSWSLVVTYKSPSSQGSSEKITVNI